jgi:hypothetical protein
VPKGGKERKKFNLVIIFCCFEFSRGWGWLKSDGGNPEIDKGLISNLKQTMDLLEGSAGLEWFSSVLWLSKPMIASD